MLPFFPVETPPHSQFDPALYPRVYCVSSGYRRFFGILGGIAIAGGCLAIWFFVTHSDSPSIAGNTFCAAVLFPLVLLDLSTAQRFPVTVFDKFVSQGNKPSYILQLASWGPQRSVSRVSVPQAFYDSNPPGGTIWVDVHSGAWHIPWYVVNPCS